MASNHVSLDAAATERKARLAKLASLKRKQPSGNDEDTLSLGQDLTNQKKEADKDTSKYLSGRNYDADTRGPRLGFEDAPSVGKNTLEVRANSITESIREKEMRERREEKPLDLFALQPKKPNWDLKRDLAKKTDILDQRTDNAIARLVRDRIEGQKHKERSQKSASLENSQENNGIGLTGADIVEGIRMREKEEEIDERRLEDEQANDYDE